MRPSVLLQQGWSVVIEIASVTRVPALSLGFHIIPTRLQLQLNTVASPLVNEFARKLHVHLNQQAIAGIIPWNICSASGASISEISFGCSSETANGSLYIWAKEWKGHFTGITPWNICSVSGASLSEISCGCSSETARGSLYIWAKERKGQVIPGNFGFC